MIGSIKSVRRGVSHRLYRHTEVRQICQLYRTQLTMNSVVEQGQGLCSAVEFVPYEAQLSQYTN